MNIKLAFAFCITLSLLAKPLYAQEDTLQRRKMKMLTFLAGNWEVEVEARLSLNGPWEKSKALSTITYTLDSALVEEEFTGTRQGKPFLSKTWFAVNNATYTYQRMFIDAPHSVLLDFEGIESNGLYIFNKLHRYANGRTVKLRVQYKKLSASQFTVETMRMPEGSTTWDATSKMKYTRKS